MTAQAELFAYDNRKNSRIEQFDLSIGKHPLYIDLTAVRIEAGNRRPQAKNRLLEATGTDVT